MPPYSGRVEYASTLLGSSTSKQYNSISIDAEERELCLANEVKTCERPLRCATSALEYPFRAQVAEEGYNPEATAWAMDAAAKGPINMSAAFLGPALLTLAADSVKSNCPVDGCGGKIFGIRPSSLLAASSIVVTIAAALLMPLMGAMIDYSAHRREVGAVTAGLLVICNASQIWLSQNNWPFLWVAKTLSDFLYIVHTVVLLAYLANLSSNQKVLATYTTRFTISQYSAMLLFMLVVIGRTTISRSDKLDASRFAHLVSSTVAFVLLGYAWTQLFGNRPPLHRLPSNASLVSQGLSRIKSTTRRVWRLYPSLKWFLITLLFSPDAGSGQLMAIVSTFETEFLQMTANQIGVCHLLTLASTIPGGLLSRWLCRRFNPLASFRICLCCWVAIPMLIAWLVQSSEQVFPWFYMCNMLWGASLGWLLPTQRVLFCGLVPKGQETEMMGLLLCFHSLFGWLPPLIFGMMNEFGWSMRWGLASSNSVYFMALMCSFGVGQYSDAVFQVQDPVISLELERDDDSNSRYTEITV